VVASACFVQKQTRPILSAQFCRAGSPHRRRPELALQNYEPRTFVEHPQSDADRSFLTSASEGSAPAPSTYLKSTMVPRPFFRAILPTKAPSVD
jgi:hypothetical protein